MYLNNSRPKRKGCYEYSGRNCEKNKQGNLHQASENKLISMHYCACGRGYFGKLVVKKASDPSSFSMRASRKIFGSKFEKGSFPIFYHCFRKAPFTILKLGEVSLLKSFFQFLILLSYSYIRSVHDFTFSPVIYSYFNSLKKLTWFQIKHPE